MEHKKYIADNNLKGITEHISYEIEMFNLGADKLIKGGLNRLEINTFLEVFLLHARCLADFLYHDKADHPDDVIASDFFDNKEEYFKLRPPMHQLLIDLNRRAGKELAHLTYNRLGITPEMKKWDVSGLWKEMNNILAIFFKGLSDHQKSWFRVISISQ